MKILPTFELLSAINEIIIRETPKGKLRGLTGMSNFTLKSTETGYTFRCDITIENEEEEL